MIRILIAYHYFPIYRRGFLKQICADSRFDVTLLYGETTGRKYQPVLKSGDLAHLGFSSEKLFKVRNVWLANGRFLWQGGLLSHLLSGRYDVVVLLGDYKILSYWIALIIGRIRGTPVFLWTHGLLRPKRGFTWFIQRRYYQLSKGLLLYGKRAIEHLVASNLTGVPLHFLGASLDYEEQKELRSPADDGRNGDSTRRLVYIGRLTSDKCLEVLLHAMGKLASRDIHLDVIGWGTSGESLVNLATQLSLRNVSFRGELLEEADISAYMNRAKAVVIPGDAGLSVLHAMAYGLPIITHDEILRHKPELEAALDADACWFFRKGDAVDLAAKIDCAVRSDPEVFDRCVQAIESNYTPSAQADRLYRILAADHDAK